MVFQANTTLFALWTTTPTGGKLAAPMVEVYADSIKWNTIQGASTYELKIFDANGTEIHSEKLGATTKNFDFATREAGEYTIQVTALASVEDKNSETTTRTFVNKALDRVSLFTVIDGGILLWNGVEGAEKYLITIECGNENHKHTAFDNGSSTTFMFANCDMQEGGIKFTVTAVAEGKASSVSDTFVYDRKLDAVGQILYNEETQSFYWDSVSNAAKYLVTVTVGGETYTVDNGSATTFSVKNLSGDIKLEIVPATKGYNSPEAATTTYTKTSLATPEGLTVSGNVLSWNAVDGATGYMVKINNQSFPADSNSLDLLNLAMEFDSSTTYNISVMALGTESSLYSDAVTIKYLAEIDNVSYKNNTLTWTPILGVENYEIRVNGGEPITVSGTNSAKVVLTKAGVNLIEVRYSDLGGSKWASTEVFAYAVTYDSRSLNGIVTEYLAMGDTILLPGEYTQDGYDFTGWYNAPEAASGNGAACVDTVFTGTGTTILYANWTHKVYQIEFVGMTGVTNIAEGDKQTVTYKDGYQLPIPKADDAMGEFMGWYTGPGGSGVVLTDAKGNSLTDYAYTRDAIVYPAFNNGVLTYILQSDGTYAVTAGPNIAAATTITIPEYYKNVAVTTILENAFYDATTIEKIVFPATVSSIGNYAFNGCTSLEKVVFEADSHLTAQGTKSFADTPALKEVVLPGQLNSIGSACFENSGVQIIDLPITVTVIDDYAFKNCDNLVDANLTASVTYLGDEAYYDCNNLEKADLYFGLEYMGTLAFAYCGKLKEAYIPATVTKIYGNPFMGCSGIESFVLDEDNVDFVVEDGVLYDTTMYTVLYYPASLTADSFELPESVQEIGVGAFAGAQLKSMTLPERITTIPDYAFAASALETITFHTGLTSIGDHAFDGCKNLNNVTILNNMKDLGDYAFANCTSLNSFTFQNIVEGTAPYSIGTHFFEGCTAMTQIILPNQYSNGTSIPAYMFANTGIVHAVIPQRILDLNTEGVFANCQKLETVTFEAMVLSSKYVGSRFFYGCTKLKELTLPVGINYPIYGREEYAGCTALEKIVIYMKNKSVSPYGGSFIDCPKLTDIQLFRVEEYEYDENENVIGYAKISEAYIGAYQGNVLGGTGIERLYTDKDSVSLYGTCLADTKIDTLILDADRINVYDDWDQGKGLCADADALKEIWFNGGEKGFYVDCLAFADADHEINVYFTTKTYQELVDYFGDDAWFTNASDKVNFYFKDTMPANVEWPEELKSAE